MSPSARFEWFAALLFVVAYPASLRAQAPAPAQCSKPYEAVEYRERREGGEADRTFKTSGFASVAVDIDSRVDLLIDVPCLQKALSSQALSPEQHAIADGINKRLAHLTVAARSIDTVARLLDTAQTAHGRAASEAERLAADHRIADFAEAMDRLIASLEGAIGQRLMEERIGLLAAAALTAEQRSADSATASGDVARIMNPIFLKAPYDWDAIRDAFARESASLDRAMRSLRDEALTIEIQAHLLAKGRAVPVSLPRYNDAAVGPETRFERMQFGLPAEQALLYARYDSLARSLESAQNLGEALTTALRVEWRTVRPEVEALLSGLRANLEKGEAALNRLRDRASSSPPEQWLGSIDATLRGSPEGRAVLSQWAIVDSVVKTILEDVDAVTALEGLRGTLAPKSAEDAMSSVFTAARAVTTLSAEARMSGRALNAAEWRDRVQAVKALLDAVKALGQAAPRLLQPGPGLVADLEAAAGAGEDIAKSLESTAVNARAWLTRALGLDVSRAIANLPIPQGQRRVALTGDVNTTINLSSIPAPRSEDDVVQVSYAFYSGEKRLGSSWHDDLQLRAFGAIARAVAGLAFATQHLDGQWSPTASLSWILSYRNWPKGSEKGFGGIARLWGIGFSTMSLNTDPDERVQIGVGGTLSFVHDRILLGYGHNLQASSQPGFFFFSLRLFSATGSLGTQ